MTTSDRRQRMAEILLIGISLATAGSVVAANVIRVNSSADTAVAIRTAFSGGAWIAAIIWALSTRHKQALVWLSALAVTAALIVVCQFASGGIDASSFVQIFGPAGAGIGLAMFLRSATSRERITSFAIAAAFFGLIATGWLALEHRMELWKLLPNEWEISKDLNYRWGHREGFERGRFIFDTAMAAGVVQWLLGTAVLAAALTPQLVKFLRLLFVAAAVLLIASVSLTVSRAGIALGGISIFLASIIAFRWRSRTMAAVLLVVLSASGGAIAVFRNADFAHPVARFTATVLDPAEEANRTRIEQLEDFGFEFAETAWHGKGAPSFITYLQAPRTDAQRASFKGGPLMPIYESTPVSLLVPFGIGGAALLGVFAWLLLSKGRNIFYVVTGESFALSRPFDMLVILTVPPFAIYSLVAPIFSGPMFSMIAYTLAGMLVIWKTPLRSGSGKH